MMNAITADASASMRCTRLDGTTRMCPANPYDCGMYTDTWSDTPSDTSESDVRNARTLSEPSAESDTSTGLSNRRFSPTNALSMSLADEYSSRTNGSFSNTSSSAPSSPRVTSPEARKPTIVMRMIVMTNPTPGIVRPSQPSIVLKIRKQT